MTTQSDLDALDTRIEATLLERYRFNRHTVVTEPYFDNLLAELRAQRAQMAAELGLTKEEPC